MRFRGNRRWRSFVTSQLRSLYRLAEEVVQQDGEMARRYVLMARRIVARTRVRLPHELSYRACHRCGVFFRPGVNARVRIRCRGQGSSLIITCLACGFRRKFVWQRGKEKVKQSEKH
ncbi:MAG: ribonuclease P protein component 4 [Promethearchaeota archaeon]